MYTSGQKLEVGKRTNLSKINNVNKESCPETNKLSYVGIVLLYK